MELLKKWVYEQLETTENNIVQCEIEGDPLALEFVKGQWNVLNHLKKKVELGHFV